MSRYLENSGYAVTDSLPTDISDRLPFYLGMDTFFLKPDCMNGISPYSVTNMTENTGILIIDYVMLKKNILESKDLTGSRHVFKLLKIKKT